MGLLTPPASGSALTYAKFGDTAVRLVWSPADSAWLGEPQSLITFRDPDAMNAAGAAPGVWDYLKSPTTTSQFSQDTNEVLRNSRPWGWNPAAIHSAAAGYAAGFTLETKLMNDHWGNSAGSAYQMALVLYPLGPGDQISPVIDPAAYVATTVDAIATVRAMHGSPWTPWPNATPTAELLAPHLYCRYVSGTNTSSTVEYVGAWARWKYVL